MRLLLFVALGLFSVTGFCGELTGNPHIIDGDSIRIADVEIRLQGIDAPEGKQMCKIKGEEWACGKAAKETLSFFSIGGSVRTANQQTGAIMRVRWRSTSLQWGSSSWARV